VVFKSQGIAIPLPDQWKKTIDLLVKDKGVILLLGGPDTGKTTLALQLANESTNSGIKTAIVDADIGQSIIGPPTTIGFALIKGPSITEQKLEPEAIYFIGDTSPFGHLLQSIVGTKRMVTKALELGAELVVVDTSGLIAGAAGLSLKYHKVQILNPQVVVGLERGRELDQIISAIHSYGRPALHRLSVSPEVKRISPETRALLRKKRFEDYFASAQLLTLSPEGLSFYPPMKNIIRKSELVSLVVGLKDENGEVLGIGIIDRLNRRKETIDIFTPVSQNQQIKGIELGFLKIDKQGNEIGRLHLKKVDILN